MKITIIKYFFKRSKPKCSYYTFKPEEHEIVLLKKLDDNKIIYNSQIYDKDFFEYYKLEAFVKKIYDMRDFILKSFFKNYYETAKKRGFSSHILNPNPFHGSNWGDDLTFDRYKKGYSAEFPNIDSSKFENLTSTQYNMLIKCYKYDFTYLFEYDLLDPELEIPKDTIISTLFNDWFYIVGWQSIKPVYPTFTVRGRHTYYEDKPWVMERKVVVKHNYDPLNEGTLSLRLDGLTPKTFENFDKAEAENYPPTLEEKYDKFRKDINRDIPWSKDFKVVPFEFEKYDEQKKFDEFDINCKTNSYHMRYKPYNEIYYKDYPEEKKFKTDLIHDFTEEEIKENYENMINKEKSAMEKWEYVMTYEPRKTAVLDFFAKLESIEVSEEICKFPKIDWWYAERVDSEDVFHKEVELKIELLLNDPRYILVKPLVDAYFEIFRPKGWYGKDETFLTYYPTNKKILKHLVYFDFSYERQYMFTEEEFIIFDYVEVDMYAIEKHYRHEYWTFFTAFSLFIWLNCTMLYSFFGWFTHYNYHDTLVHIVPEYLNSVTNYIIHKPKLYYGLELRTPRTYYGKRKRYSKRCFSTYRAAATSVSGKPTNFFFDSNYRLRLNLSHNWAPFTFLDKLSEDLDEKDYGLNQLDSDIRAFSYKYGIYRLRFYGVEEQVSVSEQLFMPKIRACYEGFKDWVRSKLQYFADYYVKPYRQSRTPVKPLPIPVKIIEPQKKWYDITRYF